MPPWPTNINPADQSTTGQGILKNLKVVPLKVPLIVIVGPTAVGKSSVAVELASLVDGEIISGDSMQVYRGMNIGTAKITEAEKYSKDGQYIPHHMLDIIDPDHSFSVADFQVLARESIDDVFRRRKMPILVGGTGLYIQAIIDPYRFAPVETDWSLRAKLHEEAAESGYEKLYQRLKEVDPDAAARIHPHDLRRIIRALEVQIKTGQTLTERRSDQYSQTHYDLHMFGLAMDRKELYRRIDERVDGMMGQGLLEEVQGLLDRGFSSASIAFQGLGYRQIEDYFAGQHSLEEAISIIKRDTRHFAKRQFTWFRRDPRINWIEVSPYSDVLEIATKIYRGIGRTIQCGVELKHI
ncbi:MAG: tRNA (adenosine(37)-N6)-dimethylallyltransferase MiaA [Bacillota bacterium]